ncbi:MAG: glutathione S-transferase [Zetaproteobacteria bacterium]|nr:MAG: glutathione S-transferase [Zetaproteobacteria bacterium]
MKNVQPILYSFRRCPYAMRTRMGLHIAQVGHEHREIILRDKPAHMLEISPKGTIPILILPDGRVIDESLDIMLWALEQNDQHKWLDGARIDMFNLIERNDTTFKALLDRYKYPNRYPDEDCSNARNDTTPILHDLDQRIKLNGALSSEKTTVADTAIFPFIRQFAHVDRDWFYAQPFPHLQEWLKNHLASELFIAIMEKHKIWTDENA